ncbi:MAG: 3-isopropylmalate dehydratase [Chloroflexi bacterium RBG_13_56_8]|nr:MAG: 3-isopropylmalate dehydratase [Chloroflexi bacterium RBG_13_56_8]
MLKSVFKGKVWKFGDNISTDYIMPGFTRGETPEERATFCMNAIRPEFAREVKPGDVIVGGRNFGCGSSRPAGQNFVTLGIGCVIAESFSRLFFRSSVSVGLPLLYCKGVYDAFQEGDILKADFETGEVRNLTSGQVLQADPLPEVAMNILRAGGVVALLKQEYGKR